MNCKPGDIAVIVKDTFHENIGALVNVLSAVGDWEEDGFFYWHVHSLGRPLSFAYDRSKFRCGMDTDVAVADSWLRPIRPDPEHAATQRETETT